jgi:hypothetical protein
LIIVNVMGELVDARTAADRLGVDIRTLYAYVSRGSLRRVRGADGRSSRYDSDELELLAQRSRPRTLPRPTASIDLVIATQVSTMTDGAVHYRGTNVLDLVKAEQPFERVADLLWQAGPHQQPVDGWCPPPSENPQGWPAPSLAREIPILQRFAIAVSVVGMNGATGDDVSGLGVAAATSAPLPRLTACWRAWAR